MTFDAEHKKVVASDMQLATTWRRRRDSLAFFAEDAVLEKETMPCEK
jgi:hypothetical protein